MHGAMTCVAKGDARHGCGALGKHDGGQPQRSVRQCRRGGERERECERERSRVWRLAYIGAGTGADAFVRIMEPSCSVCKTCCAAWRATSCTS